MLSYCFYISTPNVILDCQGKMLKGTYDGNLFISGDTSTYGGNGISVNNKNNVTIKNCKVNNFLYGIVVTQSTKIKLLNNILNNNRQGIMVDNSVSGLIVDGNKVMNNYIGLNIRRYINGEVRNNFACGNSYRDFQCMTQAYYNTVVTGNSNTFTKVTACSNGWPVLGTNYNACS